MKGVIDGIHESRKEGRRGHASIDDYLDARIQGLEEYKKECKERLIIAATTAISTDFTKGQIGKQPTKKKRENKNWKKSKSIDTSSD